MKEELRECPFCGGEAGIATSFIGGVYSYDVYCTEETCGGEMNCYESREQAIIAWNTRPVEDALRTKWAGVPWAALQRVGEMAASSQSSGIRYASIIEVREWLNANAPKPEAQS